MHCTLAADQIGLRNCIQIRQDFGAPCQSTEGDFTTRLRIFQFAYLYSMATVLKLYTQVKC